MGRPTCFHCGKLGHFQNNCRHFRKEKGGANSVEPKKIPDRKGIATSEKELLEIGVEGCVIRSRGQIQSDINWSTRS